MYVEILNPNPACLLFSAVVCLYSRLLQLVKDSPDENSLLNVFPGQYHPTCPLFHSRPKAACLMSRMPRLVVGVACGRGFPFCSCADAHHPGDEELGVVPSNPCPSLPSCFRGSTGEYLPAFPLPCLPPSIHLILTYYFFQLKLSLCFLILILHEHRAQASGFLLLRDGVWDAGISTTLSPNEPKEQMLNCKCLLSAASSSLRLLPDEEERLATISLHLLKSLLLRI